ncbi:MAG: AAA family ATPase, partial [Chloroflexota bacterium]|nr:AAA family ATPase [Chloroflexota bacterium]
MMEMTSIDSDIVELLTQLARIDNLLRSRAKSLEHREAPNVNAFLGLYVSDQEFEELLRHPFGSSALGAVWEPPSAGAVAPHSPLGHLVDAFGLSSFEVDVLLLSLLPAFDLGYERLFAYLQDDMTRRRPTVGLTLDLFCPDPAVRMDARRAFRSDAPLMRYRLLQQEGGKGDSLLAQSIKPEPNLVSFLLDGDLGHADLPHYLHFERPHVELSDLALDEDTLRRVRILASEAFSPGLWVRERGRDRWSALQVARVLCGAWDVSLMHVDGVALQGTYEDVRRAARAVRRDSLLAGAAIYLDFGTEDGETDSLSDSRRALWGEFLADHGYPVFWYMGIRADADDTVWDRADTFTLSFPAPEYPQRLSLWETALADVECETGVSASALAARYRLRGDQIIHVVRMAAREARWRGPGDGAVSREDITAAVRSLSESRLGHLAQPMEVHHAWDDLVLPDDRLDGLHEICDRYRHWYTVYDDWGFGQRAPSAGGLSALFAGPSGTGKSMAAEIIAGELGLSLYRIDLSAVVSKYIGETEKNLE